MAAQPGFPTTKKVALLAGGHHTDVVVSEFADQFLVLVTQLGKIGTVVQARVDVAHEKRKTFTIRAALGDKENPLLNLFARQLIEAISATSTKSLVLGMTLHPEAEMAALRPIVAAANGLGMW